MIKFKLLLSTLFLLAVVLLSACSSSSKDEKQELRICPQCNMELPKSNLHTSTIDDNGKMVYFDDVGCMILWAKDNSFDFTTIKTKIFSNDTKKYINTLDAFYRVDEKTPMSYGFAAYEKEQNSTIGFEEVIMKMLRGEHMANPKIRKQILGY